MVFQKQLPLSKPIDLIQHIPFVWVHLSWELKKQQWLMERLQSDVSTIESKYRPASTSSLHSTLIWLKENWWQRQQQLLFSKLTSTFAAHRMRCIFHCHNLPVHHALELHNIDRNIPFLSSISHSNILHNLLDFSFYCNAYQTLTVQYEHFPDSTGNLYQISRCIWTHQRGQWNQFFANQYQ